MNEKIFSQLMDAVRGFALMPHVSMSMILQLLCWWKLSKELTTPEELRFEKWADQELSEQVVALRKVQKKAKFPFIDESVWQNLRGVRNLSPLIQKIRALENQGFLDTLVLDDTACWVSDNRFGIPALSPWLCDLLVALAEVDANKNVYIPWDLYGQISARIVRSGAKTWVESQLPTILAQILCLTNVTNWEIHPTDPVKSPVALENGKLIQFDTTVCFPPIGVRYQNDVFGNDLFGRFIEKTPVGSVLQIRHLLAQTKGRIVVAVPNSVLFGKGAEKQLREYLVNHGCLEAVIALPVGPVHLTILIMNGDRRTDIVRFVNANVDDFCDISAKNRSELKNIPALVALVASKENTNSAVSIPTGEIAKNDFTLEVDRYVLDESARKLEQALKCYEIRKLSDLFEVIRPRQHATASTGVQVFEVQAQDIPLYGYIQSASKEALFDLSSTKANTYFIRPDDILMTFKGSIGKAGIADNVPEPAEGGWVAGQSLAILRSKNPGAYSPKALLIYLRSEMGKALLNRMAVSATIPSIQLSALKELEIPMPPLDEMNRMVQAFEQEAQIQSQIQQLRDKQADLGASFWRLNRH